MSDFQVIVFFVIFTMILTTQIMSSFQNWQIRYMEESRKIQGNKKETNARERGLNLIEAELRQRSLINNAIKEASLVSKNKNNDDYQKFTVYDTTTGNVVDYYKKN